MIKKEFLFQKRLRLQSPFKKFENCLIFIVIEKVLLS